MNYYQCKLRAIDDSSETVGWIEERGAKLGARVEMKDFGGRLFEVLEVYGMPMEETALREKQARDRNAFPSLKHK
jgi:hypothetical protein